MIKRLISFILTLVLLVAIPLEARYRYNPYTRKLDWYEAAADVDLGDLGDITLTGLANGDILYYNGTAWVNLATGANTNVLTLAAGIPSWAAPGAPAAHAPTHLAAGADPVDHDQLLNYLAAQHLTLPNTLVAVLTDHNAAAHVALGFLALPSTIAAVLTDHNLLAHTALGLFDQSADVDHDATTNWVANKHINWTAAASNFSTSENFTLAWDDAADYAEIVQMNAAGIADRPLINIDDDRTGLTADTVGEATIVMNAAGVYGLYMQTGQAYFADDTTQIEDVFITWGDAADHMRIIQGNAAGTEDQPLVHIMDDREGATVDEKGEATFRISTEGAASWGFLVSPGQAQFDGDTIQTEDVFVTWADAADHMFIDQNSEAGIEDQALVRIEDSREGATVDEISEASLRIDGEGYGLVVIAKSYLEGAVTVRGDTTFEYDILTDWDHASDHAVITQAAVAGTADQPLIFIDDDRTGLTANVQGEASLVIEAQGTYAFTILNGLGYFADGAQFWGNSIVANDKTLHFGQTSQSYFQWDLNSTKDGLFRLNLRATASDSTVVFMTATDAAVNLMDEHEDYVSPTFVLTNVQGADANDYAGVVIGERAQASVLVAHYFDFFVMTGALDGTPDVNATELAAIFRFGASGSAVPGHATTPGDVLFEGNIEVDGNVYVDGASMVFYDPIGADTTFTIDWAADNYPRIGTSGVNTQVVGSFIFSTGNITVSLIDRQIAMANFLYRADGNGAEDDFVYVGFTTSATQSPAWFMINQSQNPSAMTDHNNYLSPTFVMANIGGADANDYAGVVIGERAQADVKVAHYFDFYAMTGAIDGSVATADELPAIFRFGASGTAVPGYSTTGGDVLMEGALEVDGNVQHAAYNRYDYIYWIESFDHGIAANRYSQMWDITSLNVQGNGTNTIDTTPSHITLTTDNNAVGDNEGTITYKQIIERSRLNRSEFSVDLGQTANTQFYCGWNTSQTNAMVAAADEYVIVFFDVADNANWQIKVGDGATEDVFTSAVAADTNDIRHEIWVESDGTVHWRVNGTELDITGSVDNLMTANGHYLIVCQAQSVTGAAAIVAEMCYVENEKTKAN